MGGGGQGASKPQLLDQSRTQKPPCKKRTFRVVIVSEEPAFPPFFLLLRKNASKSRARFECVKWMPSLGTRKPWISEGMTPWICWSKGPLDLLEQRSPESPGAKVPWTCWSKGPLDLLEQRSPESPGAKVPWISWSKGPLDLLKQRSHGSTGAKVP